jgi:hypothetical protein
MRMVQIILAALGIVNFLLVAIFLFFVKKGSNTDLKVNLWRSEQFCNLAA